MSEWPLSSCLELAALPTAVPCARLHTKHVLREWGLEQVAGDIELVVSELVTNAQRAAVALEQNGRSRHLLDVPCVELRLFSDKDQVLIEVWDGNPQPPEPQGLGADGVPSLGDESGRGLFLVETLSERWGYYATPSAELDEPVRALSRSGTATQVASRTRRAVGKVVWAVVGAA